jgi:hypothetical protein
MKSRYAGRIAGVLHGCIFCQVIESTIGAARICAALERA